MSGIKMRIGISEEEAKRQQEAGVTHPSQADMQQKEEDSFIKKELKGKGVDLVVDKALDMAHISMPISMLEIMVTLFKQLEKQLENQLEQGITR